MIITIILSALTGLGIYLMIKSYDFEILGAILTTIFGCYLIIHLLIWSLASYDYNIFIEKRNAFELTLKTARENGRELEAAAITKEISEWNQILASSKYSNKIFLLSDYIDDRIETLKPIE